MPKWMREAGRIGIEEDPEFRHLMHLMDRLRLKPDATDDLLARIRRADGPFYSARRLYSPAPGEEEGSP